MRAISRAIGVGIAALLSAAAQAYTVNAVYTYGSTASTAYIYTGTAQNNTGGLWTALELRSQVSTSGPSFAFDSWCVQPFQQDGVAPFTYEVVDLLGSNYFGGNINTQRAIQRLWTVAETSTGAPTYGTDLSSPSMPAANNVYAAAFQIALWELASDGFGGNLSSGAIQVIPGTDPFSTNVLNIANGWLTAISQMTGNTFNIAETRLEYMDAPIVNGLGQDRVRPFIPGQGGADPLPLPSVAWLVVAGLGFGLSLRKRK